MTNNRLSTSSSASSGAGAGLERRRAPRIAPLSSDVYSSSVMSVKNSSLEELKARPRRPGEASFFYLDHHFQHNAVKVLPGEYFVSDENLVIMTVLGSCIAACLWDSRSRVGGMNHFMLALLHKSEGRRDYPSPRRSYAMAPTGTVLGRPSCVKRLSRATRTCNSTTCRSNVRAITRWPRRLKQCILVSTRLLR